MKAKYEILSSIIGSVFYVLDKSCRWKKYNYNPENTPAVYAIWHGLQYCLGGIQQRKNLNILISHSNDGEIIAQTVKKIGFSTIRGSMKRGGMKATREIIRALEEGKNIAYTVDGPKGPGFKVKNGVIKIAQLAQKPIIPVSSAAYPEIEAPSWDKYQLPFFFSKIVMTFGDPIEVPSDISEEQAEEYRLKLENELFRLRQEAKSKL
ncbi:MAG TPA: lysophospholipid acyltransferase family protein [Candidatus Gastranaerophilales bacterium]|nr:lysophospholipid acyltransferase family protein [Candidatus Gastranaerophilales bacterium]